MEVLRDDVVLPNQQCGGASLASSSGTRPMVAGTATLPVPTEKELTDLQSRLWAPCYRDNNIAVYACVRSKNVKKQQLRIDLRCERVAQDAAVSISDVALALPAGVV